MCRNSNIINILNCHNKWSYIGNSYWFSSLFTERNAYLDTQKISHNTYDSKHIFWHNIYIGLGFITNDLGLCYSDSCSESKARETNPKVLTYSGEYEQILKNETINICRHHPQFVILLLVIVLIVKHLRD